MGIDFGTLSARALIVDARAGEEISEAIAKSSLRADMIEGVGIDFTGCTVLPVDEAMRLLCCKAEFEHEPNAYVQLWKAHAAEEQAVRVTRVAEERGEARFGNYSGKVSSKWMLPKMLRILEESPEVYSASARFIEAGDWITALLTGNEVHGSSFAGYKALWNAEQGYPSNDFYCAVDKRMNGIVGTKISERVVPVGTVAGYINDYGAELTGLKKGRPVAPAMLDAEAAMPALGITGEGELMAILGTSSCYIINSKEQKAVKGMCGCVKDAVFPWYYTYEAGQSCVGDGYDWFVKNCVPESYMLEARKACIQAHSGRLMSYYLKNIKRFTIISAEAKMML